jgi:hypothetical protein
MFLKIYAQREFEIIIRKNQRANFMKLQATIFILMSILVLMTAAACFWLWFMIKQPEKWGKLVDLENDFWVRKGLVSAAFAERCKRREKGKPQKVMVGALVFLCTVGLFLCVYMILKSGLLTR